MKIPADGVWRKAWWFDSVERPDKDMIPTSCVALRGVFVGHRAVCGVVGCTNDATHVCLGDESDLYGLCEEHLPVLDGGEEGEQ